MIHTGPLDDLPAGAYDVVIADPPWRFASNSAAKPGRNARRHYDTMTLREIADLPVGHVAASSALLLMWVTVPFAEKAFVPLNAWGFRYKSQVCWPKARKGTGYWARNRHEILYIATRGRFPCPSPTLFPDSLIPGEQREHSRKPGHVHERIETVLPDTRRLELFSRQPRFGWDTWGNEARKFNEIRGAA